MAWHPVHRTGAAGIVAALLLAAAPLAGPLAPQQTGRRPVAEGGVIIGTVLDAETGRGLEGAKVTLSGPDTSLAIATDPLGRFYFVALPAGDYQISAESRGYTDGRYGQIRPGGPTQPLTLIDGQWRVDANVTLWRLAAIEGIVTDEAGEGIEGVRVHALRQDQHDTGPVFGDVATTLTDDRGYFRIGELAPGKYIVMTPSVQVTVPLDVMMNIAETGRGGGAIIAITGIMDTLAPDETSPSRFAIENLVEASSDLATLRGRVAAAAPADDGTTFVYPSQYYPSTEIPSLALPVELGPGTEFYGVAFLLRPVPARTVSGTVTGPAGPLSNQLVRLVPDTGQDFGASFDVARTVSNLEGGFNFLDVPAGSYILEVRHVASYNELSPRPWMSSGQAAAEARGEEFPGPPAEQWWARTPVSVFADDVEDLHIQLQPTLSVAGQIVFETTGPRPRTRDVDRIRISLQPAGGGRAGVPSARPRATGAFALHGLWPLPYYVDMALPPGWYLQSIDGQGRDLTNQPIDASATSGEVFVNVTLTNVPTEIRGTVRDRMGQPARDTVVIARPADRRDLPPLRTREARVSGSGQYAFLGLPPGRYEVVALTPAEAADWRAPGALAAARVRSRTVQLAAGARVSQDLESGRE